MSQPTHSVRLHRVLRAPPARVYRAFLDPIALVKWQAPHGFVSQVHHIDPRVGGSFKMTFTNFGTGSGHSFGGKYLELVENERIVLTDKFDDPGMPGEMLQTVIFKEAMCGTELTIVQENLPPQIPVEFCYLGWQESLDLLKQLVEPDIPDQPA